MDGAFPCRDAANFAQVKRAKQPDDYSTKRGKLFIPRKTTGRPVEVRNDNCNVFLRDAYRRLDAELLAKKSGVSSAKKRESTPDIAVMMLEKKLRKEKTEESF